MKIAEFSTHNVLEESHNKHGDNIMWLKSKVVGLEDCSRGNIITFRGIPDIILQNELKKYLHKLLKMLISMTTPWDPIVDLAHCFPKPYFLVENVCRDILARTNF